MDHLPPGMFSQGTINVMVYVLFFACLFFNIDMGILPAGSVKIKEDFSLDNSRYGTLGSVVYFGQTIGSALSTYALRKYSPKIILTVCMATNIASLILFTLTDIYALLIVCRLFTGIF